MLEVKEGDGTVLLSQNLEWPMSRPPPPAVNIAPVSSIFPAPEVKAAPAHPSTPPHASARPSTLTGHLIIVRVHVLQRLVPQTVILPLLHHPGREHPDCVIISSRYLER